MIGISARIDQGYRENALEPAIERLQEDTESHKAKSDKNLDRIRNYLLEPGGLHRYLIFMAALPPNLDAHGQRKVAECLMKGTTEPVPSKRVKQTQDGKSREYIVTDECPIFERFCREANQIRNSLELCERASDIDGGTRITFRYSSLAKNVEQEIRIVASGFYHEIIERLCDSPLLYDGSETIGRAVTDVIAEYLSRLDDRGRRSELLRALLRSSPDKRLSTVAVRRFTAVLKQVARIWAETCDDLLSSLIDNARSNSIWRTGNAPKKLPPWIHRSRTHQNQSKTLMPPLEKTIRSYSYASSDKWMNPAHESIATAGTETCFARDAKAKPAWSRTGFGRISAVGA